MPSYGVQSAEKKGGLQNGNGVSVPIPGTPVDFEQAIALTGHGKFNYLLMLAALPSAMVSVFDTTTMAYILPAAQCDLQLTSVHKGALNAITYAGMISSSLLWGSLSDRLGRHRLLVAGYLLDFACSAASAFARTLWLMLVLRYLVGFLICGPYAILMSYLAEFNGAQYRSRIIMYTGIAVSIANFSLPALAWGLLPMPWEYTLPGGFLFKPWHAFVLLCSSAALISALVLLPFGESPKFLMSVGRRDEALAQFQRIYACNTGNPPNSFPATTLVDEPALKPLVESKGGPAAALCAAFEQLKPLTRMPLLPKALLVFCIQTGGLFGMNTLRLWMPQLFATMEEALAATGGRDAQAATTLCDMLTAANVSLAVPSGTLDDADSCSVFVVEDRIYINSIIVGATSAIGYFSAGRIVNWLGKRKLLITSYAAASASGFAVFWAQSPDMVLALLAVYLAFCGICSTAILGVVVDVFPTALRTTMVALCMMFGRMGSLTGNVVFPLILDASCPAPFFMLPAAILICCIASFLLPATKGKHLE